MNETSLVDYFRWQEKVATSKHGDCAHVTFTNADRLAFLHTLIGSSTYDILNPDGTLDLDTAFSAPSDQQRTAIINSDTNGFPSGVVEAFSALSTTERDNVRRNLRRTLLVTTDRHLLGMYLPIQILFQIIEDTPPTDLAHLFPESVTDDSAANVANRDLMSGLLEWLLLTDINNETSTAYDLCAQLTAVSRNKFLLKIFQQTLREEAGETRTRWNDEQKALLAKANSRFKLLN